jgi:nucleoside-diphosphate-sugar epimerase
MNARRNDFLIGIHNAAENLTLHSAELLEEGVFDNVVKGADYVLHVASPYVLSYKDAEKELIEPAVNGTLNVLKSVQRAGGVTRVVFTSSCVAIIDAPDHGKAWWRDLRQ